MMSGLSDTWLTDKHIYYKKNVLTLWYNKIACLPRTDLVVIIIFDAILPQLVSIPGDTFKDILKNLNYLAVFLQVNAETCNVHYIRHLCFYYQRLTWVYIAHLVINAKIALKWFHGFRDFFLFYSKDHTLM